MTDNISRAAVEAALYALSKKAMREKEGAAGCWLLDAVADIRSIPPSPVEGEGLRAALDAFEAETKALPEGHEDRTKGASSYNWRMSCIREIRDRALSPQSPTGDGDELA